MKKIFEDINQLYPEVDYQALMAQMIHHAHPRRKLRDMQAKGLLVRLKKGFYVLSKELIGKDYSPQIVANLLYGPSYLSLEYALSYYQLIPERVEVFTSVTSQKNKSFVTPIGQFRYTHLSSALYPLGITLKENSDGRPFLIASPEKALMDIFTLKFQNSDKPTKMDVAAALEDDLRIDLLRLKTMLNKTSLTQFQPHYKNRLWNKLVLQYLLENL